MSERVMSKRSVRTLPNYTRGEEIFHMVSHIVGGGFAVIVLFVCLFRSVWQHNIWSIVTGGVYGTTMIALYTMSSIYHGLTIERPKKVFQVIDHCTIYFMIAGSYTPIALGPLRQNFPWVGWTLFGFVWAACLLAATLTAIDMHRFRVFSMICYLGMGWCCIFAIQPMLSSAPVAAFLWMGAGGIAYTVGSILYGLGKKRKYMHSVFHLFVLLGSALHFVCILKYIL